MMNIRTRRLTRDYEKIVKELSGSDCVKVEAVAGNPPNHYRVTYYLNGLMWDKESNTTVPIDEHVLDIYLPIGYPKLAPRCVMKTPIWHPNIGDYVCIGDYWSAGVTLVDIIAHIGDMIQYKSYNLRSPVDKAAALWAQRNAKSFPLGNRVILPGETEQEGPTQLVVENTTDGVDIELGPSRYRQ
jgi:ubiquitin-protein ligase